VVLATAPLYGRSRSLLPAIAFHSMYNLTGVALTWLRLAN